MMPTTSGIVMNKEKLNTERNRLPNLKIEVRHFNFGDEPLHLITVYLRLLIN